MKKVLFATTALIATAGVASADIALTGSANMGISYSENRAASETQLHNEIDFNIVATGQSDNGIAFGASLDIDGSDENQTTADSAITDAETFISYNGLTITTGGVGSPDAIGGTADVGFDGIGVDSEQTDGSNWDFDLGASYTIGGVALSVAMGNESNDAAIGITGGMGPVSIAFSHGEDGDAYTITALTLGMDINGIGVTLYADQKDFDDAGTADIDGTGFDLSYTMGNVTYIAAWSDRDDQTDADYGFGANVALGGGLTFNAGVGSVDDVNAAEVGFNMAF